MPSRKRLARRAVLDESGLESRAMHHGVIQGQPEADPTVRSGRLVAFTDMSGVIKGWGLWSDSALSTTVLTYGDKRT